VCVWRGRVRAGAVYSPARGLILIGDNENGERGLINIQGLGGGGYIMGPTSGTPLLIITHTYLAAALYIVHTMETTFCYTT